MCPVYAGEQVDMGPHCCDLSCVMDKQLHVVRAQGEPLLWEGDQA